MSETGWCGLDTRQDLASFCRETREALPGAILAVRLPSPSSGRGEPKLLRGSAESHAPQDFSSFATETNYNVNENKVALYISTLTAKVSERRAMFDFFFQVTTFSTSSPANTSQSEKLNPSMAGICG